MSDFKAVLMVYLFARPSMDLVLIVYRHYDYTLQMLYIYRLSIKSVNYYVNICNTNFKYVTLTSNPKY